MLSASNQNVGPAAALNQAKAVPSNLNVNIRRVVNGFIVSQTGAYDDGRYNEQLCVASSVEGAIELARQMLG